MQILSFFFTQINSIQVKSNQKKLEFQFTFSIDGIDLNTFILRCPPRFRYSEDDVVGYIVQVLQGLDYLHNRRILHLDIKPENIIITYMNMVKIIDFGSAQTFNPLFLKQFSPPVGTLEYMCKS